MDFAQTHLASLPDNQVITILSVLVLALSLCAFIVSGAKYSYFALDKKDLDFLKTKPQPKHRRVIELMQDYNILYVSLQIASIFLNLAIIIMGHYILESSLSNTKLIKGLISPICIATIIIFIGFLDVLPKLLSSQNPLRYCGDFSGVTLGVYYIFGRSSRIILSCSNGLESFFFKRKSESSINNNNNSELELSIDGFSEETASEEEKTILKGITKFNKISVRQIMCPRLYIQGIEYNLNFNEVINTVAKLNLSRLPIYKDNLDNILGLIYSKDLLPHMNETADFNWHDLIREPFFVPERKMIDGLLDDFKTKNRRLAVVVDEFGGTSGIVTIEDVHEEIIGKINDEFDGRGLLVYEKINDNSYIFDGREKLTEVFALMAIPSDVFVKERQVSDTLAGLILVLIGEFPKIEDVIKTDQYEFQIIEIKNNRLEKIKVSKLTSAK